MVNRSFYDIMNDNSTKDSLQKLCFKMDANGPQYKITFGNNYLNPLKSIENNDYILEIKTPINKEIMDENTKKNILLRLINHDRGI
jgi:hypothetical protein